MVFWTLSKPVAVSCTRLLPGWSLSSESGVLPTNWRSMNTDAPGTSDSSVSDASVGAAGAAGAGAGVVSAFWAAAFFGVSVATGEGGATFLGTMREGGGGGGRRLGHRLRRAVARQQESTNGQYHHDACRKKHSIHVGEMVHQGHRKHRSSTGKRRPRIRHGLVTDSAARASARRADAGRGKPGSKSSREMLVLLGSGLAPSRQAGLRPAARCTPRRLEAAHRGLNETM